MSKNKGFWGVECNELKSTTELFKTGHLKPCPKNIDVYTFDLISRTLDKIGKESRELKISILKNILFNELVSKTISENYDRRREFLRIADELSILQIYIIRYLLDSKKMITIKEISEIDLFKCVDSYELLGAITRLKGYGFIFSTQGEDWFQLNGTKDINFEELVTLTSYAFEFVKYTN